MEFEFTAQDFVDPHTNELSELYLPLLGCALHKRGFSSNYPVRCLLDSGADFITLPIGFARHFGVPFQKFREILITTAGGGQSVMYGVPFIGHNITLSLPGSMTLIKETIHLSLGQKIPLLGRNFFKHFSITFKKGGRTFKID